MAHQGAGTEQLARQLGCSSRTVRKWKARFLEAPCVDTLEDRERSGRPARVPVAIRCKLVQLACERPEQTPTAASCSAVARELRPQVPAQGQADLQSLSSPAEGCRRRVCGREAVAGVGAKTPNARRSSTAEFSSTATSPRHARRLTVSTVSSGTGIAATQTAE